MDHQRKLRYQNDVEKFLEENKVYPIFEDMLKALIIKKPDDPIEFLIKKLSEPELQEKKIFIIGPPGSRVRELALSLSDFFKFNFVSVGDLLIKELSKKTALSQQIEQSINKFEYVSDDIVLQIVQNHIMQLENEKQNYILEGFPKTRVQGLAFQKAGIIPDSFIILDMHDSKVDEYCQLKINNHDGYYSRVQADQRALMAHNHSIEYRLNLKQVKEIYQNFYFQVDAEYTLAKQEEILQDMATLLGYKFSNQAPKRASRVLVLGPPGSGRSTLSKSLSKKYGFFYVSTRELISQLISQKGESGRIALQQMNQGELVSDDIISALVKTRTSQTDCQIQGYVLDGYPKTENQLKCLENIKILPSLIVLIDCPDQNVITRLTKRCTDPLTGQVYENSDLIEDTDVKQRVVFSPNETEDVVVMRLARWKELMKLIESDPLYSAITFKVSGNMNAQNAFQKVSFHLEKIQ